MCQDCRPPSCMPALRVQLACWQGPQYGFAGQFAPAQAAGGGVVGPPYEGFNRGQSGGGVGVGSLEMSKPKSVMAGVWWRGWWDVIRFRWDEWELEV